MADFYLIGGDARQRYLAQLLRQRGHRVRSFGIATDLQDLPGDGEPILCLPIPSFAKGGVPGEFASVLPMEKLLQAVPSRYCILYGSPEQEQRLLQAHPRGLLNLARDETLLEENAQLTAEGALKFASGLGHTSLWHSRCLILGYGRIAKALHVRLHAMGADVCVAARKSEARTQAETLGAVTADFSCLPQGADFIFNTVPARLHEQSLLDAARSACFLELASPPYAMDPALAAESGLSYHLLTGIPGKFYPKAAARCILNGIFRGEFSQILL